MKQQVPFYLMTVAEVGRTGERIQEIAEKIMIEAFTSTGTLEKLIGTNDKMKLAKSRLSTKEITRLMSQFDTGRDRGSKALKHLALSAGFRKALEKQEASRLIIALYKEKGWSIERLGLTEETEVMDSVIDTIETNSKYKDAIVVINAEGAYAEMKEDQQNFKDTQ